MYLSGNNEVDLANIKRVLTYNAHLRGLSRPKVLRRIVPICMTAVQKAKKGFQIRRWEFGGHFISDLSTKTLVFGRVLKTLLQ